MHIITSLKQSLFPERRELFTTSKCNHFVFSSYLNSQILIDYFVLFRLSSFYTSYPVWQALPDFLKERKYQNVENNTDTALQKAWNTDLPFFTWMLTQPEKLAHFNQYMSVHHSGKRQWHEVYPLEEKIKGLKREQVFFVDVGGGIGTQSIALRKKYPGLKVRVIVQDTPDTIAQAIPHPDIEILAQNIFEPQAITGEQFSFCSFC